MQSRDPTRGFIYNKLGVRDGRQIGILYMVCVSVRVLIGAMLIAYDTAWYAWTVLVGIVLGMIGLLNGDRRHYWTAWGDLYIILGLTAAIGLCVDLANDSSDGRIVAGIAIILATVTGAVNRHSLHLDRVVTADI